MLGRAEFIIDHIEDAWKVPPETRILHVHCGLDQHGAQMLVERCRELEKVIFAGHAYALTERETINYLSQWAFVEVEGEVESHGLDAETVKKIEEMHMMRHHNTESIAKELGLSIEQVMHVLHKTKQRTTTP